jgi:hypothetical protein
MAFYVWTSKIIGRIVGTCRAMQKQRFVIRSCAAVIACAPSFLKEISAHRFSASQVVLERRISDKWPINWSRQPEGLVPQDLGLSESFAYSGHPFEVEAGNGSRAARGLAICKGRKA